MAQTPERWDVEDDQFWESTGKAVAYRNLWVSIPNLLCGFAIWIYWGMIVGIIQTIHFASQETMFVFDWGNQGQPVTGDVYRALLFTIPAVAGLAGATLRIPNAFLIAICGGRNVIFMTTVLLILPALGAGIALQHHTTPFHVYIILAALSGVGGGAFASSMSNISFFFPKRMQGLSLGLNAGLGNLGVSVMQFLIPWVVTTGLFGSLGGDPHVIMEKGAESKIWVQNSGLVWVPILMFLGILAWLFMNNLPQHKCGAAPKAIATYLWQTLLGFFGTTVGIILLLVSWGPVPELLKMH